MLLAYWHTEIALLLMKLFVYYCTTCLTFDTIPISDKCNLSDFYDIAYLQFDGFLITILAKDITNAIFQWYLPRVLKRIIYVIQCNTPAPWVLKFVE